MRSPGAEKARRELRQARCRTAALRRHGPGARWLLRSATSVPPWRWTPKMQRRGRGGQPETPKKMLTMKRSRAVGARPAPAAAISAKSLIDYVMAPRNRFVAADADGGRVRRASNPLFRPIAALVAGRCHEFCACRNRAATTSFGRPFGEGGHDGYRRDFVSTRPSWKLQRKSGATTCTARRCRP
jgi:hypothetical protein